VYTAQAPVTISESRTDLEPVISDLRTPTAFLFTNIVTGVSGCATFPTTIFDTYTAIVSGTSYTQANSGSLVFSSSVVVYDVATFPGLIMTDLRPGEIITMVRILPPLMSVVEW